MNTLRKTAGPSHTLLPKMGSSSGKILFPLTAPNLYGTSLTRDCKKTRSSHSVHAHTLRAFWLRHQEIGVAAGPEMSSDTSLSGTPWQSEFFYYSGPGIARYNPSVRELRTWSPCDSCGHEISASR